MTERDHNAIDRALLIRFSKGDATAMTAIINRYSGALVNHAAYLLAQDRAAAEDVVQDSFVKLWQHTDRLLASPDKLYLRAWLFQVCRNACLDRLRRHDYSGAELDDNIADKAIGVGEIMEHDERACQLMRWIGALPERQRSALIMAHFEAMGNAEIARIMETSVEAIENLLTRARRQLRARAQQHKGEF